MRAGGLRNAAASAVLALAVVTLPAAALPASAATPGPAAAGPASPPRAAAGDAQPALPPALASAAQAAADLRARVDALQTATEVAVEHYNDVQAQLALARRHHAAAARALTLAQTAQADAERVAVERLRNLYISGGPPGLVDLALGSLAGPDLLHRYDDSRFFLAQDRLRIVAAEQSAAASAAAEGALAAAVTEQQRLSREAAAATQAVRARLAAEQALLASASAQVRTVLALQSRAQRADADALAAQVRQLQRSSGSAGVAFGADPVSGAVTRVLAAAESQLGKPYQWGAAGPASFDCSGLVQYAFAAAGVALPRTSREQWYAGSHPAGDQARPGDLLFWANGSDPATIHHVAVYLGNGYMVAAPHTGAVVAVQRVYAAGFFGITRVAALS